MSRTRASAKTAGTRFETSIVGYLQQHLDDRIERRTRNGAKDRGDVGGMRTIGGGRIVVEAKDTARVNLGAWIGEAHDEMRHDDAVAGVVVHKRHGKGQPGDQWVTCTVTDLVALLSGERPPEMRVPGPQMPPQRPQRAPLDGDTCPPSPTPQIA